MNYKHLYTNEVTRYSCKQFEVWHFWLCRGMLTLSSGPHKGFLTIEMPLNGVRIARYVWRLSCTWLAHWVIQPITAVTQIVEVIA